MPATEPVDGIATVDLPLEGYRATTSTITFSGVTERTTPEYFSGLPMILPLGISEIGFGDGTSTLDPDATLDEHAEPTCSRSMTYRSRFGSPAPGARRRSFRSSRCPSAASRSTSTPARHVLRTMPGASSGFDIDRVVLDGSVAEPRTAAAPDVAIDSTDDARVEVTVAPSTSPAWLVLQQSWNAGWTASSDGHRPRHTHPHQRLRQRLAAASIGSFPRSITLEWAPQRTMNLALWFSLLAGLVVVGLLIWTRRDALARSIDDRPETDEIGNALSSVEPVTGRGWSRTSPVVAAALVALIAFLAGPGVALGALVVLLLRKRWPWLALVVVLVAGAVVAGAIIASEWRYDYPPGPDWPSRFGWTGPLVWLAVASVAVTAIMPDGIRRRK